MTIRFGSRPGLYVHVPFCSAICPYCDFAVTRDDAGQRQRFVTSLLAEIDLYRDRPPFPAPDGFDTVYLGGGTPSALDPGELSAILEAVRQALPGAGEGKIFLEANPEDVTRDSLRCWRDLGVGFLSLGVQSFEEPVLRFLGRRHSVEEAVRCVEEALAAGLETVSLDLIYGVPEDVGANLTASLERTIALGPNHVSCYQLTVHEGTPFARKRERGALRELSDDDLGAVFETTHDRLEAAGLFPYEVSNFASSPEHRSEHNRKYWDHTPYLGIGPSSHSFDGTRRWWNERDLGGWQEKLSAGELPVAGEESLEPRDLVLEALMLGFRTVAGVDLERIRERLGADLEATNRRLIDRLAVEGLILEEAGVLRPTRRGMAVADSLARSFRLAGSFCPEASSGAERE